MISVAVMAHRAREQLVLDLVQSIDADVHVAWDEKNNEWHTARRALGMYDSTAKFHVVLQDDALVCRDLVAGLTRAIADRPLMLAGDVRHGPPLNALISLYFGRAKPYNGRVARIARRADEEGCSWITLPQLHWGVGLVIPTATLEDVIRLGDRTHVLEYDRRLSTVARKLGMPVWYTWPSLVDHRDEPSLLRHDAAEHRRAHRFEGADWSALTQEWWGGPMLSMPRDPGHRPRQVSRKPRRVEQ